MRAALACMLDRDADACRPARQVRQINPLLLQPLAENLGSSDRRATADAAAPLLQPQPQQQQRPDEPEPELQQPALLALRLANTLADKLSQN